VILCVSADDPIQDFADFRKELARLKDSLTMGFAGVGNSSHLAWLTLEPHLEGTAVPVPYKGSSELSTALIGQQVRAAFVNTTVAGPLITGGRVRGLAVTSKSRWRQFPDMPTVAELGFPGYENTTWYTFLGPKGIPEQEADMLERDIKWTLEKQHVRDVIYNGGLDLLDTPRKVFHQEMTEEYEKWARVLAEMSKAK